jgi:hypothetical protein
MRLLMWQRYSGDLLIYKQAINIVNLVLNILFAKFNAIRAEEPDNVLNIMLLRVKILHVQAAHESPDLCDVLTLHPVWRINRIIRMKFIHIIELVDITVKALINSFTILGNNYIGFPVLHFRKRFHITANHDSPVL